MIKSLLFIGIVFTSWVMLLSDPAGGMVQHHCSTIQKAIDHTITAYSLPSPCAPVKNPQKNSHYFRAPLSLGNQSCASIIRFYPEVLFSFKSFYTESSLERYRLPKAIPSLAFVITLFTVIISTNAP